MDDKDLREDFQKTINRIGKDVMDDMLRDRVMDDKDLEKALREQIQETINKICKDIMDDMFATSEMVKNLEWRVKDDEREEDDE